MTSVHTFFVLDELLSGAFRKTADGVYRSDPFRVGDYFQVRAIAREPKDGRPDVTYEWSPRKPTDAEVKKLKKRPLTQVSLLLEIRIFAYYWEAYGINADTAGIPYSLDNHLRGAKR